MCTASSRTCARSRQERVPRTARSASVLASLSAAGCMTSIADGVLRGPACVVERARRHGGKFMLRANRGRCRACPADCRGERGATLRRMKPEVLPTLRHALLIALGLGGATSAMASTGDEPSSQTPPVCSTEIEGRSCQGPGDASFCLRDADCTDGPNGRCLQKFGMIGSYCDCEYACAIDMDCSAGETCVCLSASDAGHHRFAPRPCAPYRGNEKGRTRPQGTLTLWLTAVSAPFRTSTTHPSSRCAIWSPR